MKLLIVESPAKARKIRSILGPDFRVEASVGHVMEIPPDGVNIDVDNGFVPTYKVSDGKKEVVETIKRAAAAADEIFLATDPDREGEAISQHIYDLLPTKCRKKCRRATYDEVTAAAVKRAIANPRDIDTNLVEAQKARQVLDRLIGYKVSPVLWRKVARGTSAGRVQSVALRMVCDRQREIEAFKPEDYWFVDALLKCRNGKFWARVVTKAKENRFSSQKDAEGALADIKGSKFTLASVDRSSKNINPPPPFDTASLQSACSSAFKWDATRAMRAAQHLYENGHVSYIRTDSYNISEEAMTAVRGLVAKFGQRYLPASPNIYKKKSGAAAQEAHECIRPTHVEDEVVGLDGDERKLYDLVRDRFIACQMTPAVVSVVRYDIDASCGRKLVASGQTVEFDGFQRVWQHSKSEGVTLPAAERGEGLDLAEAKSSKHTTKPPDRYNDGSIIKRMEAEGVGRPSTRATILKGLQDKGYVAKDGNAFVPLPLGLKVCDFLTPTFSDFFMDIKFTAGLEDRLDEVATGKSTFLDVVSTVYEKLKGHVGEAKKQSSEQVTHGKCTVCKKGEIVERFSRFGQFYSCNRYPECKTVYVKTDDGMKPKVPAKKTKVKCPECGKSMMLREHDGRQFLGCSGYPKCRKTMPAEEKSG